ncbi:hypothetical protein IDH44_21270 [Paenibacillus sp. IB182496]|uniref:Uncharacterized protein n=1 Tax=Paenibacillus sabuli TaxID=2772509 RepID=A0A927BXJ0_9BACL|nr:hypothetical protein [Paenibacillus sabuli]MBD2847731.1 hypothetical protein [Paenibacillus sabuli]
MKKQTWKKSAALGVALTLAAGASAPWAVITPAAAAQGASQQSVFERFEELVRQPETLDYARKYLLNRIDETNKHEATVMTLHLENAQEAEMDEALAWIEGREAQQAIGDAWAETGSGTYTALLGAIDDEELRAILMDIRDRGYKIATSEGMYFPVINYSEYARYAPYIRPDIAAYAALKAIEANDPSIGDAALRISHAELLDRALAYEDFLGTYAVSNRRGEVEDMLQLARLFLFYGPNNTPLFGYETAKANEKALDAYRSAIEEHGTTDSELLATLEQFLELLEQTDGERTDEVDAFLEEHVPNEYPS